MIHVSDELIQEHAYTVARGVRAVALVGHGTIEQVSKGRIALRLAGHGAVGALPFVIDRGDGFADFGFAARQWALDLYAWAVNEEKNAVPDSHRHRILGLLLGYSADAIAALD